MSAKFDTQQQIDGSWTWVIVEFGYVVAKCVRSFRTRGEALRAADRVRLSVRTAVLDGVDSATPDSGEDGA